MKIKVIQARNKKLNNKILDLGDQNEEGLFFCNLNKKIYRGKLQIVNNKLNISFWPTEKRGVPIIIEELEIISTN